jgi:hypothetical protein
MYKVVRDFRIIDYLDKDVIFPIGNEINYNRKDDEIIIYYLDINGFTCTKTKDFDIEEYLEPIEENNEDNQPKTELIENKSVKHLHVLQFDNLLVMNKELEKINEDDVVSITPIKVNLVGSNEDTIIYSVIARR